MKEGGKRVSYLSVHQFHALDLACSRINQAFGGGGVYLVGSVAESPDFRDVDVRLILDDKDYAKLSVDQWALFGFGVGAWLSAMTGGLPIDFQVQQQTTANKKHPGPRNPLGGRTLMSFRGDGCAPLGEKEEG